AAERPPAPKEVVSRLDADSTTLVVDHATHSESSPQHERASVPAPAALAEDARPHIGVWTRHRLLLEDVLIAERAERNGHHRTRLIDHQCASLEACFARVPLIAIAKPKPGLVGQRAQGQRDHRARATACTASYGHRAHLGSQAPAARPGRRDHDEPQQCDDCNRCSGHDLTSWWMLKTNRPRARARTHAPNPTGMMGDESSYYGAID